VSEENMNTKQNDDPEMLEEYDFSGGVRGKYVRGPVMNKTHACPICSAEVVHFERYLLQVCGSCGSRACDADGRLLEFGNISLSGGFAAIYSDTREIYDNHLCYIDDIACHADEHRFGGIVISRCAPA
jgi:hypothetical protein